MTITMTSILDLPLDEQKRIAERDNFDGMGDFEGWVKYNRELLDEMMKAYQKSLENDCYTYTQEEADALIADIIANPEDKVGFAKRMAVDPDTVTAERMIENIRAKIRKA